jgi:quercetin dioxygenase-like cupin family protein
MNMNRETIQLAKINKTPILFKGIFPNTSNWSNFINHLDFAMHQDDAAVRDNLHKTVGQAHFWSPYTIMLDNAHLHHKGLKDVLTILGSFLDSEFKTAFGMISFTTMEPTVGRHEDSYEVFYLQCEGAVDWHVQVGMEEQVFRLENGDIIFVPANTTHEVKSITPRAGISIMFNKQQ